MIDPSTMQASKSPKGRFGSVFRHLRSESSGVAMIEFAYAIPFLLTLGMLGTETANLVIVHMQVSQIAMQIADSASRVGENNPTGARRVFERDINDVLVGGEKAGEDIEIYQRGRVILSSLQRNASDGQTIRWQRCRGAKNYISTHGVEGAGATGTSFPGMGNPSSRVQAAPGTAVMFVEIAYDYKSITPFNTFEGQTIVYTAAFNIRDTRDLTQLYNSTPAAPVARCNVYSAARPA